jgi:ABC-type glycerol-3-phosphate transport system substrate-binding protein
MRFFTKKTSALVATASIMAMVGTATFTGPAGAAATPQASSTTLQLSNDKPGWTIGINAIGRVLASLDGGVGWQAQPYSSTTAFQGVVRAAATTSQAPPVFTWWSGQQLVPLVKAGALANMTSLVKVWEAKYGLNPDVENAYEVNGQYYGAPLYTSDWVMYYNKKDFAKYGLGGAPMTWAQLMSDAATLHSHGIAPFDYYVDDWAGFIWFEQFLLSENPTAYHQLVLGQISYTSAPVVKAMEAWKQVADLGYFSTAQNIDTALSTPISFANGSTAMLLIGSWQEGTLIKAGMVPGKDFGAFIVPPINPAVGWQAIFETGPVVVSAHNSNKQAALNSVNTFMEPSVQVKWDTLESFVSAETSVKTTDVTAIDVNNEIAAEHVHLWNRYWEATPPQIAVPVASDLSKFILNPNLPLMPFLATLQDVATSYWSTAK